MKMLAISAAAMAAALAATPASARVVNDQGFYAGLGATYYDADQAQVTGATGRLGYRFNPNFGVEGEASFGIEGDTADFLGTPVDVDLDNQYGAYAVGFLPVSDRFELLGRVGYAKIDAQGSYGGFTAGADDDGVAAGVGAQWALTDNFALRGDYTRLSSDNDGVNAWGLSGVWSF
ncbi:MAG TPA: porin family protein [Caulobacterales bacterium]|nr:porin family protein [Caulobacterales bacterium]